jgi:hypothetical protein
VKGDRDWRPSSVNRNYGPAKLRKAEKAKVRAEAERCHIRDHDGEDEYKTRFDPKQFADREDRYHHPWIGNYRSAYATRLGPEPTVPAGARQVAAARAREIEMILAEGLATDNFDGVALWTRNERQRLKRMAEKWRERARGENAYFNIAGTSPRATEWQWANIRQERNRLKMVAAIKGSGRNI